MALRKLRAKDGTNNKKKLSKSTGVLEEEPEREEEEQEQPETDYEFREVDPSEIKLGYENDVKDWLSTNKLLDREYRFKVYKYSNPNHGERKELVGDWTDYVPSEHEIGQQFGGGKYIGILHLTDDKGNRRVTSAKFRIHESYDQIAQNAKINQYFPPSGYNTFLKGSPQSQPQNGGSLNEALETIGKMMAIILPAIQSRPATGDYSEIMMENYKMINSMMKRSILDNMQLATDLNRRNAGLSEVAEDEDEVTGAMGIINQIAPLLEKFLPYITGGHTAQAKAAITAVQALPEYQRVIKSKAILKGLCEFIDTKHGAEVTDTILARFKVKRPARAAAAPAPVTSKQ